MRAAKVQASLRIRAVSPEPPLLARRSSESIGTLRQKARSLASLNNWACAVKICHDGMLEDTNSLDGTHLSSVKLLQLFNDPNPMKWNTAGRSSKAAEEEKRTPYFDDDNVILMIGFCLFFYLGFKANQDYFTHFEPS